MDGRCSGSRSTAKGNGDVKPGEARGPQLPIFIHLDCCYTNRLALPLVAQFNLRLPALFRVTWRSRRAVVGYSARHKPPRKRSKKTALRTPPRMAWAFCPRKGPQIWAGWALGSGGLGGGYKPPPWLPCGGIVITRWLPGPGARGRGDVADPAAEACIPRFLGGIRAR